MKSPDANPHAGRQQQFLDVIDRDEAERRFHKALRIAPLTGEVVPLREALGRILATDVAAAVNVPSFDRSNFDGFALQATDTYGAEEESPNTLRVLRQSIATAVIPTVTVEASYAAPISTGGMMPRGADAVVLVEHTELIDDPERPGETLVLIRKPVPAGFGVSFTGSDIAAGETILRRGQLLTSRDTGVLAAIGLTEVTVHRRPRVAIISTGDEIIAPGEPMEPAKVYDSNARILADAVREQGGIPSELGIVSDDLGQLDTMVSTALHEHDIVLLSGGTSKGAGDLSYRVVEKFDDPGIVAHGVALKPGKPICLAVTDGKPVVILPGFPTSAIFTFHEFVAPVIRRLSGRSHTKQRIVTAQLAVKINSEVGRKEYNLVGLVHRDDTVGSDPSPHVVSGPKYIAFPMGKGSGSVTTFSHADGFIAIDRNCEIVEALETVDVQLLGRDLDVADLVIIGSHCLGLDFLIGLLRDQGIVAKFLAVGSTAGLAAAKRGECDVAGIHLLDAKSGQYNEPFVTAELEFVHGYDRQQGVICRVDDLRFAHQSAEQIITTAANDPNCLMINRNQGSGTRILVDGCLAGKRPAGYEVQARTHSAVAAAVLQGRADWGVAIKSVARDSQLQFAPLKNERFDFVIPKNRRTRPSVIAFVDLLKQDDVLATIADNVG